MLHGIPSKAPNFQEFVYAFAVVAWQLNSYSSGALRCTQSEYRNVHKRNRAKNQVNE